MTPRRVAAVGLLAIAGFFLVLLLQRGERRSGSDLTPNGNFVVFLTGGQYVCQGQELLPAHTAALRMTIGTYGKPGPPIQVSIRGAGGALLARGGLPAGWRQGIVRIPLEATTRAESEGTRVCLRNGDPPKGGRTAALAGDAPDPGYQAEVDGRPVENLRVRFDYLRPGSESWLELLPRIAQRISLGKAGLVRHWAWAAVLALMIAAVALAVRTLIAGGALRAPEEER